MTTTKDKQIIKDVKSLINRLVKSNYSGKIEISYNKERTHIVIKRYEYDAITLGSGDEEFDKLQIQ